VIEQAKGMVMATSRCTPEDAFRVLAQIGSRENLRVAEIARRLVEQRPLHD
jgi:AmiR/NasT family two-component response regulator